jgi:DNA repair photolyase
MGFKGWDKVVLETSEGKVEAVAPVIISASRSTDIPGFHSEWFVNRLNEGYVKWINPFNRKAQYISFDKTRVIVFWSKNPQPLLKYLPEINQKELNYYFTYTVNDYEEEGFEPNVPLLNKRIDTFKRIAALIGKERIIWRFDPLILTDKLNIQKLLEKISHVGNQLYQYTDKLVISFVDIHNYGKVERKLGKAGHHCKEFTKKNVEKLAKGLEEINREWKLEIATCAEEYDLSAFSIAKNKCIDDGLLIKMFKHDEELMKFLGYYNQQADLFNELNGNISGSLRLKDRGQRRACRCIVSKDIGQYDTCPHLCAYCYANTSNEIVKRNFSLSPSAQWLSIIQDK